MKKRVFLIIIVVVVVFIIFLKFSSQTDTKIEPAQKSESDNEQEQDVIRETELCSAPTKLIEGYWANPSVIKLADGKLRMYYDCEGNDNECKFLDRGVHSAISYDGKRWTKESIRRLTSGKHPFIFELANYKLYFTEEDSSAISVVASYDGINFESNEPVTDLSPQAMIGLVISEIMIEKDSGLEDESIGEPSIVMTDNGYRMYYTQTKDDGTSSILSAFSSSGLIWKKEEGERIDTDLFKGEVHGPEIIKDKDKFVLYFSSEGGIYRAFSDNGLNFETPRLVLAAEDREIPSNPAIMKSGDKLIIYYDIQGEGIYSVECEK